MLAPGLDDDLGLGEAVEDLAVEQHKRLENAAHNAAIAASHFGSSTSPLHVLAGSVKTAVTQTSSLTTALSRGLQQFRDASRRLEQADLAGELGALVKIQERARAVAERQSAGVTDFQRLQDEVTAKSRTIARAADAAGISFGAADQRGAELRELAQVVDARVSGRSETLAGSDLGWIEALCTMEDERAVHRELFPSVAPAQTADSAYGEEELDDFLL